jgi:hypothetical protein
MATLTIAEQVELGRLCRKLGRGVAGELIRRHELGLAHDSKISRNHGKRIRKSGCQ